MWSLGKDHVIPREGPCDLGPHGLNLTPNVGPIVPNVLLFLNCTFPYKRYTYMMVGRRSVGGCPPCLWSLCFYMIFIFCVWFWFFVYDFDWFLNCFVGLYMIWMVRMCMTPDEWIYMTAIFSDAPRPHHHKTTGGIMRRAGPVSKKPYKISRFHMILYGFDMVL